MAVMSTAGLSDRLFTALMIEYYEDKLLASWQSVAVYSEITDSITAVFLQFCFFPACLSLFSTLVLLNLAAGTGENWTKTLPTAEKLTGVTG